MVSLRYSLARPMRRRSATAEVLADMMLRLRTTRTLQWMTDREPRERSSEWNLRAILVVLVGSNGRRAWSREGSSTRRMLASIELISK